MCGIVGYSGSKRSAIKIVTDGLKRLEYRGYDSSGIAYSSKAKCETIKSVGKVSSLIDKLGAKINTPTGTCIGHTRWATHGGVTENNAHPHTSNVVAVVHNGIIDNSEELKEGLIKLGYEFKSETDTEVLAHLIDSKLCGDPYQAVKDALAEVHGTYGIAVIFDVFPGTLVVARNGSPLVIGICDDGHLVASDPMAISQHTNRFMYLEDGDIAMFDVKNLTINNTRDVQTIDFDSSVASLGDHKHFMSKEIKEQPESIKRCFGGRIHKDSCELGGLQLSSRELSDATSVTIIGCGTSYHAGLTAKNLIEDFSGIRCSVELASEFNNKTIIPDKTGIYLAISQSGETYDTIESILELHKKGCKVYGIINTVGSTIARLCGAGVYTHCGPEISVASTKAYTGQLSALYMFASMLGRSKSLDKFRGEAFNRELASVPDKLKLYINSIFKENHLAGHMGRAIASAPYVLFLGRGASYPVAMEGALKLKEIAYVPCEAYAGGEMKHGPIAMIEHGTPVICLNPKDRHNDRMLANMHEIRARGGLIYGISDKNDEETKSISDITISLPPQIEYTSPFFTSAILQIAAYFAAIENRCDVDRPRNLAKSVTVS